MWQAKLLHTLSAKAVYNGEVVSKSASDILDVTWEVAILVANTATFLGLNAPSLAWAGDGEIESRLYKQLKNHQ